MLLRVDRPKVDQLAPFARLVALALLSLLIPLVIVLPAAGAEEGASTAAQVAEMLRAELSEEVILAWLEGAEAPPQRPSAEELIALKEAGASDELLTALLALSRGQEAVPAPGEAPARLPEAGTSPPPARSPEAGTSPPPAGSPEARTSPPPASTPTAGTSGSPAPAQASPLATPPTPPGDTARARPAAPSSSAGTAPPPGSPASTGSPGEASPPRPAAPEAPAGVESAGPPAAPPAADGVLVTFRLAYSPLDEEGEEEWDLLVYLDGKPLTQVPPGGSLLGGGKPLQLTRRLAAGSYRLRVTQERHEERRGGWRHAARVAPQSFLFELRPGLPATVEVELSQRWAGAAQDPLTYVMRQGERVTELENVGGYPEDWPELCEELEANLAPGAAPGRRLRRQLQRCVRWQQLWPEGDAPSRTQVRDYLERFDYRPVSKGS